MKRIERRRDEVDPASLIAEIEAVGGRRESHRTRGLRAYAALEREAARSRADCAATS